MNPLAVLGRVGSLVVGMVATEWQAAAAQFPWADGEEPILSPEEEDRRRRKFNEVWSTVPQSSAAFPPEAAAVEVPTPETALPQPGVGNLDYPVIDPGELREAAAHLQAWSSWCHRDGYDHGMGALSARLREYADALTAFDNQQ